MQSLSEMQSFYPGDAVRVIDNEWTIQDLQRDHGGWDPARRKALGQEGIVRKVYPNGDVEVEVGDATWTFNPLCLKLLEDTEEVDVSLFSYLRDKYLSTFS